MYIYLFFHNSSSSDKMKSRNNKIVLSGIIAVFLAMTFANSALASSFPQQAAPGNIAPRIYLINSSYDICYNDFDGGSRPDGFNLQTDGCLYLGEYRFEEYAFTGEQLMWRVVVRDLNGAQDISYAKFTVGGLTEALCTQILLTEKSNPDQIPAWETAPAGFNSTFDKAFMCRLTVEPQWAGQQSVNIDAYDQSGAVSTMSIAQSWFFNPAVSLILATNDGSPKITYEPGVPGQTVMSTNKLVVTNNAAGGVDLWAFIAADDLTDPSNSGALCPVSNVLDVDKKMEYRCKIGTFENDPWHLITNKDNTMQCGIGSCYNAQPLTPDIFKYSIIGNLKSAECQFRLTYPVPCIGNFSQGLIHIIVKAL